LSSASGAMLLLGVLDLGSTWHLLIPIAFGFLAVYLLLPRPQPLPALLGWLAGAVALFIAAVYALRSNVFDVGSLLFYIFAVIAVLAGGCLVTLRNPVYAALSFALVVLSTCGLFLLQAAPFLMAATIIVYAGAIIVTFMFVIMLAQQQGASDADARSREPFLGSLTGFLLLAALVCALQAPARLDSVDPFAQYRWGVSEYSRVRGAGLDNRAELPAGNVAYIGRALFTDFLLAVELGGTLLLAATIGTILITTRRPEAKR
jgi:NADH-quinone oxidoreductase subunit J